MEASTLSSALLTNISYRAAMQWEKVSLGKQGTEAADFHPQLSVSLALWILKGQARHKLLALEYQLRCSDLLNMNDHIKALR